MGCIHEGLFYFPDYDDFMESQHRGDSTTAYMGIKDHIRHAQKKVIIHRDLDEVKESVARVLGDFPTDFLWEVEEELKALDGLHVDFYDINDRIEEIWRFCRNDPFPENLFLAMRDVRLDNHVLIEKTKEILRLMGGLDYGSM